MGTTADNDDARARRRRAERTPIELAGDRDPWERQPGESQLNYSRFALFRDFGPERTLRRLGETLRSSGTQVSNAWIYQISHLNLWDARVRAWDAEQDRLTLALTAQKRRDMAERHARLALGMVAKATSALTKLKVEDLKPADLVRLIDVGTRLEREALGQPSASFAVTGADGGPVLVDYSQLSADQRAERMAEIAAEAARRAGAALLAEPAPVDDDDGE